MGSILTLLVKKLLSVDHLNTNTAVGVMTLICIGYVAYSQKGDEASAAKSDAQSSLFRKYVVHRNNNEDVYFQQLNDTLSHDLHESIQTPKQMEQRERDYDFGSYLSSEQTNDTD